MCVRTVACDVSVCKNCGVITPIEVQISKIANKTIDAEPVAWQHNDWVSPQVFQDIWWQDVAAGVGTFSRIEHDALVRHRALRQK